MNCDEAKELLEAYALGALDEQDRLELEEALERCPECGKALEEYQDLVQRFPGSVTLVDPPPELKGRLLAKIDAYEAERGKAGERSPVGPRSRLPLLRSTLAFSVFSFSRRELMWVPLGAVMLLLVSWSIVQTLRVNDLSDDNGRLASQVEDQQEALTFVASPSVQSAELQGSDPEARGTLFMDPTDNEFLMLVTGLVPLEEGRVYQLWAKRPDGSYASLGTFRTYPNGSVLWPFRSVAALVVYHTLSVSLEPDGGSAWPTSPTVLEGSMPGPVLVSDK